MVLVTVIVHMKFPEKLTVMQRADALGDGIKGTMVKISGTVIRMLAVQTYGE
jgi:hypothetical protein